LKLKKTRRETKERKKEMTKTLNNETIKLLTYLHGERERESKRVEKRILTIICF